MSHPLHRNGRCKSCQWRSCRGYSESKKTMYSKKIIPRHWKGEIAATAAFMLIGLAEAIIFGRRVPWRLQVKLGQDDLFLYSWSPQPPIDEASSFVKKRNSPRCFTSGRVGRGIFRLVEKGRRRDSAAGQKVAQSYECDYNQGQS